ncbi:MAG: MarR family transcriptional regulator [Chloroflexota bacterium]|jgi:DNA-binding MarR family transcriptional regulator
MNDEKEKLYSLLKEAFLLLDFGDRQLFARYNLTISRYYALYHINQEPGLSISQLSDGMFCDKSNATRVVKGLEKDGLVIREPHETDGRTLRLFLTPAGQELLKITSVAHNEYNQIRLNGINEVLRRNLIEGLDILNERLRDFLQE